MKNDIMVRGQSISFQRIHTVTATALTLSHFSGSLYLLYALLIIIVIHIVNKRNMFLVVPKIIKIKKILSPWIVGSIYFV